MNAQELYEEIKSFLKYVNLSFSEMDQVKVFIQGDEIEFRYKNVRSSIKIS